MISGTEYPKWLHHPGFAPAVLSDDYVHGGGRRAIEAAPGKPAQFPPVVVHNSDQEEYYVSRGYNRGAYDHQAVMRQQAAPLPNGYREQEYPKYGENGEIIEDPNPEPVIDPAMYPMWVGNKIAKNAEEERALCIEQGLPLPGESPAEAARPRDPEWEEFLRWKASVAAAAAEVSVPADSRHAGKFRRKAKSKPKLSAAETRERDELIRLVNQAGGKADARYSLRKLREMLDEATKPAPLRPVDDGEAA